MAIPQGGDFAFVIFTAAVSAQVISQNTQELLVLVVSLSMAATPVLQLARDWMTRGFVPELAEAYNVAPPDERQVIIAGFGSFGQIVGRILAARRIGFVALDSSAAQVDFVRKFGSEIYYGDASRLELLRAAKADTAKVFLLAIDDVDASLRTAETVVKHFPHLKIYARARNRRHAHQLMDLGVTMLQRETYLSSLDLAREVLLGIGFGPIEASRTVATFRDHDQRRLYEHYTHYTDEEKMRSLAKASAKELEEMFAHDAAEAVGDEAIVGTPQRKQQAA